MEEVMTRQSIFGQELTDDSFKLRLPVKLWIKEEEIEASALEQIYNLANLPFAYHHIAIMPDVHAGYGMPIGSVLATQGVIVPNAVGVDIGCGMCAVKTNLKSELLDKETFKQIFGGSKENPGGIRSIIPVGFNHHSKKQDEKLMPPTYYNGYIENEYPIIGKEYESALKQIGTLGGGNHFIEIQKDQNNEVWIMIHSGSRNLGKKVADHYNKIAVELNEKYCSSVPKKWQLAFLPLDSDEGQAYLREMQYCIDFALANRNLMMKNIIHIIENIFRDSIEIESWFNIAHNYASMENHFGKNVMVHRKGATCVREGTIGIIPGSQGTKSYIVKGLGNPDSFNSCSHGSGRKMSRTKAQNELNLEDEIKLMDEQGIVHGMRNKSDLDESASAYKDINKVIDYQTDIIEVVYELTPIGVIKG